jgi:integrase
MWLATALPARARVKSQNTVDLHRWAVDQARSVIGAKTLRALAPEDVERLLVSLVDRGLAHRSILTVRSSLVMALKWGQRRKLVAWNAAELAEMPAGARPSKEGRSLTLEEAKALLTAAQGHRLGALVTVGVMLGLRPGELCGLRWADIDLDSAVLHVRQARKRESGEDGIEVLTFGAPKTPKSRRSLDLPAPAVAALRRHKTTQADERLRAGRRWVDLDLVFATSIGTPINPSNLRREIAELTQNAGIGRWTPKELRHSAGSLLSAAGVPLERIADLLGHVDTRMLERVYRHPVTKTVDAAAAPMTRMFDPHEC